MTMKTVLIMLTLAVAANALSIESFMAKLRSEIEKEKRAEAVEGETLGDYLKKNPISFYKQTAKRSEPGAILTPEEAAAEVTRCKTVCGPHPVIDHDAVCATSWAPDMKTVDGCECLKEFRCCPQVCDPHPLDNCHREGMEGYLFGTHEKDCCDCDVVKCMKCQPPESEEATCKGKQHNLACYTYEKEGKKHETTKCYESTCPFTPENVPVTPDAECDEDCMSYKTKDDICGREYKVCKGKRFHEDCPYGTVELSKTLLEYPLRCYADNPASVDHAAGGKWYIKENGEQICKVCNKYEWTKNSCAAQDQLADDEDCHQNGDSELDKICWKKVVDKDECDCKVFECTRAEPIKVTNKFPEGTHCPKHHVKKTGVSICNYERDICLKCNPPSEPTCNFGVIETSKDANGCPTKKCELARIPQDPCSKTCDKFKINRNTNTLECDCH